MAARTLLASRKVRGGHRGGKCVARPPLKPFHLFPQAVVDAAYIDLQFARADRTAAAAYAQSTPGPASELTALIFTIVDVVGAVGSSHHFERNWGRWSAFVGLCMGLGSASQRRLAPPVSFWRWWPWTWLPAGMRLDSETSPPGAGEDGGDARVAKFELLECAWRCALPHAGGPAEPWFPATIGPLISPLSEVVGTGPLALAAGLPAALLRSFERATDADYDAAFSPRRPLPDWTPVLLTVNALASSAPHLSLGTVREMLAPELTTRLAQITAHDKSGNLQCLVTLAASRAMGAAGAALAALQHGRAAAVLLPGAPVAAACDGRVQPWAAAAAAAHAEGSAAPPAGALGVASVQIVPLCGWAFGTAPPVTPAVPELPDGMRALVFVPTAAADAAIARCAALRGLPRILGLPTDVVAAAIDVPSVLSRAGLAKVATRVTGYASAASCWVAHLPPQLRAAAARVALLGQPTLQTRLLPTAPPEGEEEEVRLACLEERTAPRLTSFPWATLSILLLTPPTTPPPGPSPTPSSTADPSRWCSSSARPDFRVERRGGGASRGCAAARPRVAAPVPQLLAHAAEPPTAGSRRPCAKQHSWGGPRKQHVGH